VQGAVETELETVNAKMLKGEGTERLAHGPSPVNRVEPVYIWRHRQDSKISTQHSKKRMRFSQQ
jgi:hypothetical protein